MADDETKQDTPQTSDDDADQDDVAGHRALQQRQGDDSNPEAQEEGRPTPNLVEH